MTIEAFAHPPLSLPLEKLGGLFPLHQEPPPGVPANPQAKRSMEVDDAPILRYLYQAHQPRRHLEFGTWQGGGTCLCLEACNATVWTLNLPDGESKPGGKWSYGERVADESRRPSGAIRANYGQDKDGPQIYHRTDAGPYIGRLYREKGLGHRVCQIYCDSRQWDQTTYPKDFFDSVLVDGGHQPNVVINDTRKALAVLRPGGLLLWHDFCPLAEVRAQHESVRNVTSGLQSLLPEISPQFSVMRWIDPSWILLGVKK